MAGPVFRILDARLDDARARRLRALVAARGYERVSFVLGVGRGTLEEAVSGGGLMPSTIRKLASALDAIVTEGAA